MPTEESRDPTCRSLRDLSGDGVAEHSIHRVFRSRVDWIGVGVDTQARTVVLLDPCTTVEHAGESLGVSFHSELLPNSGILCVFGSEVVSKDLCANFRLRCGTIDPSESTPDANHPSYVHPTRDVQVSPGSCHLNPRRRRHLGRE